MSDLICVGRFVMVAAAMIARASDSPLMRWAAHSDRISVHGMPHTFSVYVLKKIW